MSSDKNSDKNSDFETRRIVLAARPEGKAAREHFRIETAPVAAPGQNQMLVETLYLSLDPYMRSRMDDRKSYSPPTAVGAVMEGESIAKVLQSNLAGYQPGDLVLARTGWQTHSLSDGERVQKIDTALAPLTTRLGVLGMP